MPFIKAYKGVYGTGELVIFNVPGNVEPIDGKNWIGEIKSGVDFAAKYPNSLDLSWTFFATSEEDRQELINFGCTNIFWLNPGDTFYFSKDHYFRYPENRGVVQWFDPEVDPDDPPQMGLSQMTLPSYGHVVDSSGKEICTKLWISYSTSRQFAWSRSTYDWRELLNLYEGAEGLGTDPYEQGGNSGTGGGTGTFDGTGDAIEIPSLPTLSAVNTGFITLFNPTISEMLDLSSYMWSDLFDLATWKKIFADPMQAILGLSIVPVAVASGGIKEVKVGNISTGVNMTVAQSQYAEVDCGTLDVKEYWGAYLDYDPFTKAEIYLPYIGTHPISTDDIMGKQVHVVYHVDILSGSCCAYVKCGESVLYTFVGQCSSSIPITGDNWTNVINGAISIAGSIGTMVATGGMSAPMAAGNIASTAVNSMKPSIEKSGAMGGTGGMLGIQTPYLILTRPRQALPKNQNLYTGYPSFITEKLSEVSGYTEIESIHLENILATEQELSEIENLLKGGVII